MIHPDEGRLRALLDDELEGAEARGVRGHLDGCPDCTGTLHEIEAAGRLCTTLLCETDVPAPTDRVRARLAERRARLAAPPSPAVVPIDRGRGRTGAWIGRHDLAKAALLLLGFSGAVAAAVHPASPVRRWLADDDATVAVEAIPAEAAASAPTEVGVRLAAAAGRVLVAIEGAAAGAPIEVRWVEDGPAAVYAPEGSSFSTSASEGRIGATVTPGPIRVELPRATAFASLSVGGLRYLEKTGERVDYPGPPAVVEGSLVRFRVR